MPGPKKAPKKAAKKAAAGSGASSQAEDMAAAAAAAAAAKAAAKAECSQEVPDADAAEEAAEQARVDAYLADRKEACVREFARLIDEAAAIDATQVVVTNHPSYDLSLGIAGHNGIAPASEGDGLGHVSPGNKACADYLWAASTLPFFRECWRLAGGVESPLKVFVFENGMGDMCDLDTGAEPPKGLVAVEGFTE
jgi:hypothetical protein